MRNLSTGNFFFLSGGFKVAALRSLINCTPNYFRSHVCERRTRLFVSVDSLRKLSLREITAIPRLNAVRSYVISDDAVFNKTDNVRILEH